jgi:hypothetical protein
MRQVTEVNRDRLPRGYLERGTVNRARHHHGPQRCANKWPRRALPVVSVAPSTTRQQTRSGRSGLLRGCSSGPARRCGALKIMNPKAHPPELLPGAPCRRALEASAARRLTSPPNLRRLSTDCVPSTRPVSAIKVGMTEPRSTTQPRFLDRPMSFRFEAKIGNLTYMTPMGLRRADGRTESGRSP